MHACPLAADPAREEVDSVSLDEATAMADTGCPLSLASIAV